MIHRLVYSPSPPPPPPTPPSHSQVRSTPTFFIWRGTSLVHTHSGANKAKAEHAVRDAVAAAGGGGAAAVAALPPVLFPVEPKATGGW
jgi:hypothetical protein